MIPDNISAMEYIGFHDLRHYWFGISDTHNSSRHEAIKVYSIDEYFAIDSIDMHDATSVDVDLTELNDVESISAFIEDDNCDEGVTSCGTLYVMQSGDWYPSEFNLNDYLPQHAGIKVSLVFDSSIGFHRISTKLTFITQSQLPSSMLILTLVIHGMV